MELLDRHLCYTWLPVRSRVLPLLAVSVGIVLGLGNASPGLAQTTSHTWGGGSVFGDNWSDVNNWTFFSAPPTSPGCFNCGTNVTMTGSRSTSELNQVYSISNLTFQNGMSPITIYGDDLNILGFGGNIVNEDNSTHTFDNDVNFAGQALSGGFTFSIQADLADIDFNGTVSMPGETLGSSDGLTITVSDANSDVFFDGGFTSTGSGEARVTTFGAGQVWFRSNVSGIERLNINGSGEVILNTGANLGTSMDVNVGAQGEFDLNDLNTNINELLGFGTVDLGSANLTFGETTDFTFNGSITGTGGITKNFGAVATLSGSNTYTGTTSVTNGTLRIGASHRISNSSSLSVSTSGTFDLDGFTETVHDLSGSGTILLGGGRINTSNLSTSTQTFSGDIQESGTVQKNGSATLSLTGTNNTYTLLDINAGTVQVDNAGALGSGSIDIGAGTLQNTSALTNSRPISLSNSAATINVNSGATFTQSAVVSGNGSLNKEGNGTLELGASNTYTGDTNINDGLVRLLSSNRLGNSTDVGLVAGATLQLNNFSDTVASLSGPGGNVSTGGSNGRLTVNASSGTFTYNGFFTGSGGLTKQGGHTLVIGGSHSNGGATNITGGTLRLAGSGSLSNASDITINNALWDLNGVSDTVDSISGNGTISLGSGTLTVDESASTTRTFSGNINGSGGLVKNGTHTLVLSSNNTYSGTTTMGGGTLQVASSPN